MTADRMAYFIGTPRMKSAIGMAGVNKAMPKSLKLSVCCLKRTLLMKLTSKRYIPLALAIVTSAVFANSLLSGAPM